jgi:hypothetical protein
MSADALFEWGPHLSFLIVLPMPIDSFKKEQRMYTGSREIEPGEPYELAAGCCAKSLSSLFFSVIETWRPVASKPSAELRRYFIGGTPELDNILYCGNCANGIV